MYEGVNHDGELVFGLDIGTRNIVGTVGYMKDKRFHIVVQECLEHETRAMLDGQIHDIGRVGERIKEMKQDLDKELDEPIEKVCIAAAGRVLRTVEVEICKVFDEETMVSKDHIHALELFGVDKAQRELTSINDTTYKFYSVGYSVVYYMINGDCIGNLEGHKANQISARIIVTFLPEDVIDGLYSAVNYAGLEVANLTLEPIAAINVAIPENFRMLNIALVDVGAGTSDISITRDGSIVAYGMIPYAGDEITELIAQHYLVDFNTAEQIKRESTSQEIIEYKDIMMLPHQVEAKQVWELVEPVVDQMAEAVGERIIELNGDKPVSAVFIVGGGGKIHGFTDKLADKLGIIRERVALRGEEVLGKVDYDNRQVEKDPLLVTPIGICLNYYEQKNNFIYITFNGEEMKLYDNSKLTLFDAAVQAGFPNEKLFPQKGRSITYIINGKKRIVRGEIGESAVITKNGEIASLSASLENNSTIVIQPSTVGKAARITLDNIDEFRGAPLSFDLNGQKVSCPKMAEVNGQLQPEGYYVQDGDLIEMRSYYTISQILVFFDIDSNSIRRLVVNNKVANLETFVYNNFAVEIDFSQESSEVSVPKEQNMSTQRWESSVEEDKELENKSNDQLNGTTKRETIKETQFLKSTNSIHSIDVVCNGVSITLTGKTNYVFVDVLDYVHFDSTLAKTKSIVTKINDREASFTTELHKGDKVELYWQ